MFLNFYIYNCNSSKTTLEYKKGKILTMDRIEVLNIDRNNNNVVNDNGEKYSIIHHQNRCDLTFFFSLVE
jgi:hypothetical protein